MKNILLLLVLVAVFGLTTYGQNRSFNELSFNLSVLKSEVVPLEPISLKLTLENRTDKPITVDTSLLFSVHSVTLEIKQPGGKIIKPSQLSSLNSRVFVQPKDIPSGDKMESSQLFGFHLNEYMGQVGEYKIRASFRNKEDKMVRSNWVSVTVAEPAMTDASAYQYITEKTKTGGSDFQLGAFYEWSPEEMEAFLMRFPETTYAIYVQYSLGECYFEKEKARAAEHFRALINAPNFIFANEVNEKLKKLDQQLKGEN